MASMKLMLWSHGFSFSSVISVLLLVSLKHIVGSEVPDCGTIDEVIARQDKRAQVPWLAALYYQSTLCDFRPAGNGHGVIIGPTTILLKGSFMWSNDGRGETRMESYSPNHFMIAVGLKSFKPFAADQHTQFLKVHNIQPHYNSHNAFSEYDYAIVHLQNPIQFSSFVRPLCVDILPEDIFDRSNTSLFNERLVMTGFKMGPRSPVQPENNEFGLLSPEFCSSKLKSDLLYAPSSPQLITADAPCGVLTKPFDEVIDVRSAGIRRRSELAWAHLKKLLNFTYLESAAKSTMPRTITNACFFNGASVITLYQGKWHLVGIVTESLGTECDRNMYFVSLVAYKSNLNWILQHLRTSPSGFVCSNGQSISLEESCNGKDNCLDGSDEDPKVCTCAPGCNNSHCLLQPMCKHCEPSPDLKVYVQKYKFSTAESTVRTSCPPVFPPSGASVHCKAPGLKAHVPCEHAHFPGTQAVYTCQHFDKNTPASYCVTTCLEAGKWTNELQSFRCSPKTLTSNTPSEILLSDRRNLSASVNNYYQTTRLTPISSTPRNIANEDFAEENPILFAARHRNKNGTSFCPPLQASSGTEVQCFTSASSRISCFEEMQPGAKAQFTCKRYHRPVLSTPSVIKQCQPDGQWSLSNRNVECRLDCGIPKSELIGHIVNGLEADGAKWPWHGLIFISLGQSNLTYICGSTLISKRVLVTAAHCVTNRQGVPRSASMFKVILASVSNIYHKNIRDENIQIFDVSSIIVHPLFNVANFEADIAIIQLSRPAEVNDYVRPSCYPSTIGAHTELKHLSPGSAGKVVGFGYDESGSPSKVLKEAALPVVSYKDCYDVSKIQHSHTQYCAGYTNSTSACNGDSGGGHFFKEDIPQPRMFIQGIISHGNKDVSSRLCDRNQYSVFTKVASFKDWISQNGLELDDEF